MKGEKRELNITHISFSDFCRLGLKGYVHRKVVNSDGTSRLVWNKVRLSDEVNKTFQTWGEETGCSVFVAVHIPFSESQIRSEMRRLGCLRSEAISHLLYFHSYLDKYLTPFGAQTYLIGGLDNNKKGVKVHSKRNYFFVGAVQIDKRETLAMYVVHK